MDTTVEIMGYIKFVLNYSDKGIYPYVCETPDGYIIIKENKAQFVERQYCKAIK